MVTVDSSVWVAAAEQAEPRCAESRAFFADVVRRGAPIYVPAFLRVEIGCALSRRRRDAEAARALTDAMLGASHVIEIAMDPAFMAAALRRGTDAFVRGADALFVATAAATGSNLVSWDGELLARGGALTPADWVAGQP